MPETFFLKEEQCNFDLWNTRVHVLDADQTPLGHFQTRLFTWNMDLAFYRTDGTMLMETDIHTFGRIRHSQEIFDANKRLLATVEEEIATTLLVATGQTLMDSDAPLVYRRYTIYNPFREIVGVIRKTEFGDTEFEVVNPQETAVYATAYKSLGDKIGSIFCGEAMWKVQLYKRDDTNPATNPDVLATVFAIKAKRDVQAAAGVKYDVLNWMSNNRKQDK